MEKIFSISEITRRIRTTLEKTVGFVWVEGEISNLTYHPSGHIYLTLKDPQSQLSGVIFRGEAARLRFRLKDGMKVHGHGRITVYEKSGRYQIVLETVQLAGMGNLQAAFEMLKKKLAAEGLFDTARKRPIPEFPQTIGLITSPSGAAVQDFCRILHRRFPGLRIVISPTRVQGEGAAQEIVSAIDLLNIASASGLDLQIDVIAIIRGGGSLEDLWAFNEEIVARAIARSKIPTISGVGHEVDFTICDLVADMRAATPSAAAEIIIHPKSKFISEILDHQRGLQQSALLALAQWRNQWVELREALRLKEPRNFIREWRQRLDEADTLHRNITHRALSQFQLRLREVSQRFTSCNPMLAIEKKRADVIHSQNRLQQKQNEFMSLLRHRLDIGKQRLTLLSPSATLARGYSITINQKNGRIIRSIKSARRGQAIVTKLADGDIQSIIH